RAQDETEGHGMATMLARHDCKTEVWHRTQDEPTIGAQILKEARISGTDLIVMGAFGHNRLHDILFTDATREVIRKAEIPVLFSA
ncbi:MAG: universal stress protein, partial [Pseudomonadota bacterium]